MYIQYPHTPNNSSRTTRPLQSQFPLRELREDHRIQKRIREPVLEILKRPALLIPNRPQRRCKLRDLVLICDGPQVGPHVDISNRVVLPTHISMISNLAKKQPSPGTFHIPHLGPMRPHHQRHPRHIVRVPLIQNSLHERDPRVVFAGAKARDDLDAREPELAALLRRQDRSARANDAHLDPDTDSAGGVVLRDRDGIPPGALGV